MAKFMTCSRRWGREKWPGKISQGVGWGGGGAFFISMHYPLSERLDSLRNLRPHPHDEPGYFWTAFFTRIRVDRILNHSGEWFQKDAFSVGGFTGFSFLDPSPGELARRLQRVRWIRVDDWNWILTTSYTQNGGEQCSVCKFAGSYCIRLNQFCFFSRQTLAIQKRT